MDEDYEDYYDEEENALEEARDAVELQEQFTFNIDISSSVTPYIKAATEKLVAEKVTKLIDEEVSKQVRDEVASQMKDFVKKTMKLKIKKYDYSGNVTSELSLEDLIRAEMEEITKQGLNYKVKHVDSYGREQAGESLDSVIKQDIYTFVSKTLKPKFDELQANFQKETQKVLRDFTLNAVDEANKRTLKGY